VTNTLCVDIGNYSVLSAVVSGRESSGVTSGVTKMRSLIYDATHNGECRNNVHPKNSPLVTVNGKAFKVGDKASTFPGFLSAAEAGKSRTDIILPILLANTPDGFEGVVKMLVPTTDEFKEKLITNEIIGTHAFSVVADGSKIDSIANFTGVEFVRETDAAAKFAYETGAINPDDVVLVIDIGGGTVNTVVCSYDNDVFSTVYRKSYDNSGGIALAQTISNTDVVKSYGRTFEIAKIMDAISNDKLFYGNRQDLSFASVWESCVDVWFDALLSRVMASTDKYLDEVTTILWCGGGSEIIRTKVADQPGHLILDNPQLANINGLIHSAKPQLRLAA
jgi:StbA protein